MSTDRGEVVWEEDGGPFCRLFPTRLLGMGLLFAWDWCMHGESTMELPGRAVSSASDFTTTFVLAEILVLIGMAAFSRRIGSIGRHPRLTALAGALGVLGTLLAAFGRCVPETGAAMAAGGGLAAGAANALLLLGWAEVYARLSPGRAFLFGSLSLLAACATYALATWLTPPFGLAATAAIPALCCTACWLSLLRVSPEPLPHGTGARYTFPWKPVLITGAFGFTAAFVDVALFAQGTLPHVLADLVAGLVLALAVAVMHAPVKPVALVGISIALVAAGVLAVALFGAAAAFPSSLLVMLSYVTATFFTYALLANICRRHGVPSLWLFGCAAAARTVMDHVGGFANRAFPDLGQLAESPLDLAAMAAVGLAAIGVMLAVWLSERSFNSAWSVQAIDIRDGVPIVDPHEALLARCEHTAAAHGLTEREGDILVLLAEGRTYQQMSDELLLSGNTVKTHARHMYAKLGVHTRDEALALVNGTDDTPQPPRPR